MTNQEDPEVFGDFDPAEYKDEVRERWGETDAYRESARRTAEYSMMTGSSWAERATRSTQRSSNLETGVAADSPEAMDVAERHRTHITKWFYECSREIHSGLGDAYVTDRRFADNIDKAGPGLAQYMSAAIAANAGR